MNEEKIDIDLDDGDMTDEMKEDIKNSENVHIHKTSDDGEDVNIDIDKNKKSVEVNVDKEGKKTKVNIGLSGIKVNKDGKEKVNIQFLPIFLFAAAVICGFLFFIYKVVELIISAF